MQAGAQLAEPPRSRRLSRQYAAVALCAILVQLAILTHVGTRVYSDVNRAINFGHLIDTGAFDVRVHANNSKTFVGPVVWYALYRAGGVPAVKLANVLMFVLLSILHFRLGRFYPSQIRLAAFVIFALYYGTSRNVAVGEPDDMMQALLFSGGVLVYLDARQAFASGLLMGLSFVFKFSAAIFIAPFGLYLTWQRRWRDVVSMAVAAALPFLLLVAATGRGTMWALQASLVKQYGYSSWSGVAEHLFFSGSVPAVAVSAVAWIRHRTPINTLFFMLSASYCLYALLNRDAFAAMSVMMQCLMFSSFLIAEFLFGPFTEGAAEEAGGGVAWTMRGQSPRAFFAAATLAAYAVVGSALAFRALYQNAKPIELVQDDSSVRKMFPWNFPGWPRPSKE